MIVNVNLYWKHTWVKYGLWFNQKLWNQSFLFGVIHLNENLKSISLLSINHLKFIWFCLRRNKKISDGELMSAKITYFAEVLINLKHTKSDETPHSIIKRG